MVVAVSGGMDSVVLLHLLNVLRPAWRLTLHIAHLDHGLREESGRDAQFVRELAAAARIPSTIERREVEAVAAREGWSLEDGARRIRYQFLLEVARRQSAAHIALAHTADDQAETVLMRLVRGTGLMGLGAIPIQRQLEEVRLVRPLLELWRREIAEYARAAGLVHREDATNADRRFVRNRIRHELLPLLERRYNPNVKGALTQLAEQSRADYAYLSDAAERQWKRTVRGERTGAGHASAPGVSISIAALLRQPKALQRQLVRQAIQRLRGDTGQLEFRHWLEVERLCVERPVGTVLDLPGGVQLCREQERITCRLTQRNPQPMILDW